jgi:hypothetical protein
MKSKEELKAGLHKLIDSIEDEELLTVLNEDILPSIIESYSKEINGEEENETHDEGIPGLDAALNGVDNVEPVSPEEFKKMTEKWGTK